MDGAEGWYMCRVGLVETLRAVGLAAGPAATRALKSEWPAFGIVEVDQALVEHAATLAVDWELRSMDSLHLAAALVLPGDDLAFATWDRRLHAAAAAEGLGVLPETLR
jgi:predicted nucleic acid-binding protein